MSDFERGDPVTFVPVYADSRNHEDCEYGVVTDLSPKTGIRVLFNDASPNAKLCPVRRLEHGTAGRPTPSLSDHNPNPR